MNRLMTPSEEAEQITQRHGVYVPPHKLARISQNATQVLKLLTRDNVLSTYQEIILTLDTVRAMIERSTGGDK
ncbi:MAG: hypothetical protein PUE91_08575 [Clostridiales bacterium]|nr:hypothetical protein [Clostridiales bacterium]